MNKKIILISLIALSIFMGGCGSKTISNNTSTSKVTSNEVEQTTNETINQNTEVSQTVNKPDTVEVKEESKKQEYKTKLDNIEIGLKSLKEKDAGTTLDMKAAANERLKQWDLALNEIYNALKGQLSASDMKKLQSEETKWMSSRDAKAKKESLEMKGGTMESLIYTSSLQATTKSRCYELVEKYMK